MRKLLTALRRKKQDFNSKNYWEQRYAAGGNSGDGSYGKLAVFKADFINDFVKRNAIGTAVEFGCGDGHQLSLIEYPSYLGLDVSVSAIRHCAEKFRNDPSKSFFLYDGSAFFNRGFIRADLALSLDVLYHIIEEQIFIKYITDLFSSAGRYVIVYATNFDRVETIHVLHRRFTAYVEKYVRNFTLVEEIANPYPGTGDQQSEANFFVFKKDE
jgi:hypothetical protein